MSLPLIISEEAEHDIAEAKAWYDKRGRGLGDQFVLCVEEALERIRRIPGGASEVYPGVRRVMVRRFPFGVFYCIEDDQIGVIAVYDSRRDPRGWQQRI
jgi:plasmid stabilization system protein ParE